MKTRQNDLNLQDNNSSPIRLQTYIAHSGVTSRRNAEKLILDGRVKVNGKIVTELGTKILESDEVFVDDKKIGLEEKKRYILLHKPVGIVCSLSDEKGRTCAADLLKPSYKERLYNVGRLDMFSSGLIIFTNDGDFAQKISHPSSEIEKEYLVETTTIIPEEFPSIFEKGIRIQNIFYRCQKATIQSKFKIKIILTEGKNREIRKVFAEKNIGIRFLKRVRIGNLTITNLKEGQFREIDKNELNTLLLLCQKNGRTI